MSKILLVADFQKMSKKRLNEFIQYMEGNGFKSVTHGVLISNDEFANENVAGKIAQHIIEKLALAHFGDDLKERHKFSMFVYIVKEEGMANVQNPDVD